MDGEPGGANLLQPVELGPCLRELEWRSQVCRAAGVLRAQLDCWSAPPVMPTEQRKGRA